MLRPHLSESRILAIDADETNLHLAAALQRKGFHNVSTTRDLASALRRIKEIDPDLVVIIVDSSVDATLDLLKTLRKLDIKPKVLPVFVMIGNDEGFAVRRLLETGANDVVVTPVPVGELVARLQQLLEVRLSQEKLVELVSRFQFQLQQSQRELRLSQLEALYRLSVAAELRDDDTGQHIHRVGSLSAALARTMGLDDSEVRMVRSAAPLHDIGKVGISDAILRKKGRLTPAEFEEMTTHTLIGARILENSQSPLIQLAEQIALCHHEHWDGGGYPRNLKGEQIPLAARIVTVADVFDALTHARSYKKAWSRADAEIEIERLSGTKFDPRVVHAFQSLNEHDRSKVHYPPGWQVDATPVVRYVPHDSLRPMPIGHGD